MKPHPTKLTFVGKGKRAGQLQVPAASTSRGARRIGHKRSLEEDPLEPALYTETGSALFQSGESGDSETRMRKRRRRVNKAVRMVTRKEEDRPVFQHLEVRHDGTPIRPVLWSTPVADPDPLVAQFVAEDGGIAQGLEPEKWSFVQACTRVEMEHLKHFDRPVRGLNEKYRPFYNLALAVVKRLFDVPVKLEFPRMDALERVRYRPMKYPGVHYFLKGHVSRREADPAATVDAKEAWVRLMEGERVEPRDVYLGGRGKLVEMSREEVEASPPAAGRLILMIDHRDYKILGVTEQLLTAEYAKPMYPLGLGLSWWHGGTAEWMQELMGDNVYYCFDAKKFDSSLDGYMVKDVISILREQFVGGDLPQYDAYWQFVYESLMEAPIHRCDGYRILKKVGTTSGHNHNTLIQSLCTELVGWTTILAAHPKHPLHRWNRDATMDGLGDDNLMAISKKLPELTVEEYATIAQDAFGVDWFGKKSFATDVIASPKDSIQDWVNGSDFESIQYLGKYFRMATVEDEEGDFETVFPVRPFKETFLHMLYPEKGGNTPERTWLRALGNYIDGAGNPVTERWMSRFLDWLDPRVPDKPEEWEPDQLDKMSHVYGGGGEVVVKPKRMGMEEWIDLLICERAEFSRAYHGGVDE